MRDDVLFYINGTRHQVRGADAFLSLSDYLRRRSGLTGTKVVCAEGDCGACTVLIGRTRENRLDYHAVNSCIQFVFQLDGTHVVTVEGISQSSAEGSTKPPVGLHPVQNALATGHGSQCGFCTPGMVMALAGGLCGSSGPRRPPHVVRDALTGNLCRCTGYVQVVEAACNAGEIPKAAAHYPEAAIVDDLTRSTAEPAEVSFDASGTTRRACLPKDVAGAVNFKAAHPEGLLVNGATDIGVQINKGRIQPSTVIVLSGICEFEGVRVEDDDLVVGGSATWTEVEQAVVDRLPEFHRVLQLFGAPQIRHAGTLAGNVANASPIADSLPLLYVLGASVQLVGASGSRSVAIESFYEDYKKTALRPDELIRSVRLPLPDTSESLKLYKVSARRHLDIAAFTAAIRVEAQDERIQRARIAYGGVGPMVVRLPRTEEFLRQKTLSEDVFRAAGRVARSEIHPISDVRGSEVYRLRLAETILLKFFHESHESFLAGQAP